MIDAVTVLDTIVVIEMPAAETVTTEIPIVEIIEVGLQGKQGIQGDSNSFTIIAPVDLGGHRVVMANGYYADNSDMNTVNRAIGVTQGAATAGSQAVIICQGALDGLSGLVINNPLYLSSNGTVTQTLPVAGYIQQIGVASSETRAIIGIKMPLVKYN